MVFVDCIEKVDGEKKKMIGKDKRAEEKISSKNREYGWRKKKRLVHYKSMANRYSVFKEKPNNYMVFHVQNDSS